jgi:hypothetical protein
LRRAKPANVLETEIAAWYSRARMKRKKIREFEELEAASIRAALAEKPGAWLCAHCDHVFGPEDRFFDPVSAPDLVALIGTDGRLCGDCFLSLTTTPPPNWPKGGGSSGRPRT